MSETQKKVPAAALRLSVGQVEFGDNGEGAKTAPIRMVARSGQPIEHWFWGKVVHDLSGMTLHKSRIPVDYVHAPGEVLGYLNHFDTSGGDLVASGALTPFKDGDRASEVIYKARQGVPYEASINFGGDGIKVEEIAQGQVAQVNGYAFEGPGMVIRQWPLRGVAVCPYGADMHTASELSEAGEITVTCLSTKENAMETGKKPVEAAQAVVVEAGAPVEAAAVDTGATQTAEPAKVEGVEAGSQELSQGAEFLRLFGDKGGVWFAQGKTLAEAQELFVADLQAQATAKDAEIVELKTRLSALPRGAKEPVEFDAAEATPPANAKQARMRRNLPKGLADFAASIKLPEPKGQR